MALLFHIYLSPALLDSWLSSSAVLLPISSCVLHPVTSTRVSCLSQSTQSAHSQTWVYCRRDIGYSPSSLQFAHSCVAGSPLREDSPVGSPYVLSASSPEQSLSSLSSPSSRHLIHRESPDLREPEEDDHHTVNAHANAHVLVQEWLTSAPEDTSCPYLFNSRVSVCGYVGESTNKVTFVLHYLLAHFFFLQHSFACPYKYDLLTFNSCWPLKQEVFKLKKDKITRCFCWQLWFHLVILSLR